MNVNALSLYGLYPSAPASPQVLWGVRAVRHLPFFDLLTHSVFKNYLLAAESWVDTPASRLSMQEKVREIYAAVLVFVVSMTSIAGTSYIFEYDKIDSALLCTAAWVQICLISRN